MKLKQYFFMITLAVIAFMTACTEKENIYETGMPVIQPLVAVEVFRQERGLEVPLGFEIRSINGIRSLEVLKNGQPYDQIEFQQQDLIYTYNFSYVVENLDDGTEIEFTLRATDREGQQSDPFSFVVLVGPPFSITPGVLHGEDVLIVNGRINRDTIFRKENLYLIDGNVPVEENKTLTIEAGTTLLMKTFDDDRMSRLVITQGSKINAKGTKDEPIVFTSEKTLTGDAQWGDWAGLYIFGRASTNQGSSVFEFDYTYGGSNDSDNSGTLEYVRVEYSGKADQDAFNFLGVGSETQLSNLAVYECLDNAVRFKGGTASLKYLVVINHGAYGLWAEHGWRGNGQFWVFQTDVPATIVPVNFNNIARSVELRSDPNDFNLTPRTFAKLSNITMIGNGFTDADGTRRGFRCRRGAWAMAKNFIATNFPNDAVRVEDVAQENLDNGNMVIAHVRSFSNKSNYDELAEDYFLPNPDFDLTEDPVPGISPTSFVGSEPSPFNPANDPDFGNWFTSAPFIGAVENTENDWTSDGVWVRNQDGTIR